MTPEDLQSVWVLIPALNEQESLPLVLNDIPNVGRVIVTDNGSSDATPEKATEGGADLIRESRRGYGSACLAGMDRIAQLVAGGTEAP